MDEEYFDYLADFSNYTGKALERNYEDNKTKEELINEIINNTDIKLSREILEQLEETKLKYLKVLSDCFEAIIDENSTLH